MSGCGFAFPRIGLNIEAKLLALDQVAHAGALDGRDMHEHIGAVSVLRDEPEALLDIEKLDGTCGHLGLPENAQRRHYPFEPLGRITNPDLARYGEGPRGRQLSKLTELAQSEFELASRFVAAPESNQGVGWLGRADLGM